MRFDNQIINEIDRKLEDVTRDPKFYLQMYNGRENGLHKTEFLNSFLIEHPEYYKGGGDVSHRGYTREVRAGVKSLQNAWGYLKALPKPTGESLRDVDILNIGRRVDPLNNYYRNTSVSLNLKRYNPPAPKKVPILIEEFFSELRAVDLHPIERAAFAHSRIVAIQPFIDGNKRTARLIQNKILVENGYPYSTIPLAEREYYLGLLEESMCAYRDKDMKRMGPFFNYVAAKVNVSLDEILFQKSKRRK